MEPLGALSGGAGGMADAVAGLIEQRMRQAQVANQATALKNQAAAEAETARHNAAVEGQTAAYQTGELANTASQRRETANKDFVTNVLQQMPIGTPTTPDTRARAATAGVDPNAFAQGYSPPSMGMSTPTGEVGPSAEVPQGAWRGTQAQIETAQTHAQAAADRELAQQNLVQNRDVLNTMAGQRERDAQSRADDAHELGMMRLEMMRNNADKKASTLTVSAQGKNALSAIETAAPLTDQVIAAIEKQYPDINSNPDKYNSLAAKADAQYQKMMYTLGFTSDDESRKQIESLLQPVQVGQYMRSARSRQMLDVALSHMADQGQTIKAQYDRLRTLRALMPEMREGVIRAEQPVDPNNPLAGSYLGRAATGDAGPAAPTGGGRGAGPGAGGPVSNDGWIDVPDPSGGPPMRVRKKPQ